jgi:hypothetical protein
VTTTQQSEGGSLAPFEAYKEAHKIGCSCDRRLHQDPETEMPRIALHGAAVCAVIHGPTRANKLGRRSRPAAPTDQRAIASVE